MTMRSVGRVNPEFTMARSTRCVLSRTAASGNPTSIVFGNARGEISTSTSTAIALMPTNEKVFNLASIPDEDVLGVFEAGWVVMGRVGLRLGKVNPSF